MRKCRRRPVALLLTLAASVLLADRGASAQERTVQGIDAIRLLCSRGRYSQAEQYAYRQLWKDMEQPQALYWLAVALGKQGKNDDAAVYFTYFLRVAESAKARVTDAQKRQVEAQLKRLNTHFERAKAQHEAGAATRRFDSPESVSDLWMTEVKADLFSFYCLHHWVVVGGIKNRPAHWNTGKMHRSGMRLLDDYAGRKGVLFTPSVKRAEEARGDLYHERHVKRLGHPPYVIVRNPGRQRYLRIGAMSDGQPVLLKVHVGEREAFSRAIGKGRWEDVKIDLGEEGARSETATLELTVPKGQHYSGGIFLDYVDFFAD